MDIFEKARELAEALRDSEAFQTMKQLEDQIDADAEALDIMQKITSLEQEIRQAMTQMIDGTLLPNSATVLQPLYHTLLLGDYGSMPDSYFVLKDFGSYSMAQRRINEDYANRDKWLKMAVINTAMSGVFSSDRTIREYNDRIWHLEPLKTKK